MQVTVNSFKKIVDQRWCVITRGIPFILILLSLKVLSNLNLVTFVSTNVLGHLLLKNQDLILFQCLIKSFAKEHVLLTCRVELVYKLLTI